MVHVSSSSSACDCFRWAFFGRNRGSRGEAAAAFFQQFDYRHARHARGPRDASLRVPLDQQLRYLRIPDGFGHRRRHKPGLVAARFTLVFGLPTLRAVASDRLIATASAQMLRKNRPLIYNLTL